jgi:hypothetical protein
MAEPHAKLVSDIPQLQRGRVWCVTCGATRKANVEEYFRNGWPKCCGQTMTIDSPGERRALARVGRKDA